MRDVYHTSKHNNINATTLITGSPSSAVEQVVSKHTGDTKNTHRPLETTVSFTHGDLVYTATRFLLHMCT